MSAKTEHRVGGRRIESTGGIAEVLRRLIGSTRLS